VLKLRVDNKKITILRNYKLENAYPITLPTLKPPKTNPTARERSSNGIDLHVPMNLTN